MSIFGPNIKKMEEKKDINGLIKELKNKDPKVRIEATKALSELRHIKGLIDALKNDNPEVRAEAISALENTDEPEVVELLIEVLTTDNIEVVCHKALITLSKFHMKDEKIWKQIAIELLKKKKYENALMCFEKVIENNLDKETLISIGSTLVSYERYKDALKYFERFIEGDPNDPMGWEGQGLCLSYLNRDDEAISSCKKALEIDPKSKAAKDTLSAIYHEKNDYKSLFLLAEETLRVMPEDTMAHVMMSEALASTNKLVEAESTLQKALDLSNQKEFIELEELCLIYQRLGIIYAMRGHREKAQEAFQKAVDTHPTDEWVKELKESYEILDFIAIAMKGNPADRRARLFKLTNKRADARRGKGISKAELAAKHVYEGDSPIPYMKSWQKDQWLSPFVQGVMIKLWPSEYVGAASQIASSKGLFEAFQKGLEEKIME